MKTATSVRFTHGLEHSSILLRQIVWNAIHTIRQGRLGFVVKKKRGYASGKMDDVFTTVDVQAQEAYINMLTSSFPGIGFIAEEDGFREHCSNGTSLFAIIDAIDGTEAFIRKQSHNVGTMLAVVKETSTNCFRFVMGCVGDVNTQELYMLDPGSQKVFRHYDHHTAEELVYKGGSLRTKNVLLFNPVKKHPSMVRRTIERKFKSHLIDSGSLGIMMARLWKGEVGGMIIGPWCDMPWDWNPVLAISKALGFVVMKPWHDGKRWVRTEIKPIMKTAKRNHHILIVHESNVHEVNKK